MATFNVCSRLPLKRSRFQITVTDVDGQVSILRNEIGKHVEANEHDFDILYAGQILKTDCKISKYSLQNQSTLYIVPRFSSSSPQLTEETGVSSVHKNDVFMAIHSALLNDEYKNIVERMLTETDTVENIIATTPGLDKDPSVLAMLLKPELLTVLAQPNNIDSVLQHHPSFAQAAVTIATAVNEEGAKSGAMTNSASVSYSMDQMSDEDEDVPGPSRPRASGGGQSITASQLAAALQAATGSSSPFEHTTATQPRSQNDPTPSGSSSSITNDFFQQAMLQAQNASSEASLQQLRDMGITDDNVARQALAATNGDIQAAIDLIFGDGFM